MPPLQTVDTFERFAITTPRLIIVPTPIAVSVKSYRALYAALHADASFCEMGFGHHFLPISWSDDETREVIETRDIDLCWKTRGIGDFAVGLRAPFELNLGSLSWTLVEDQYFDRLVAPNTDSLTQYEWVGYVGIRDASTTSLPPRAADDPDLPPWQEMIELRYGVSPEFWGQGVAEEAAEAIIQWGVQKRGVRRFIAETERDNVRSAKLLQKLGFVASGTNYWKEPSEIEWELSFQ